MRFLDFANFGVLEMRIKAQATKQFFLLVLRENAHLDRETCGREIFFTAREKCGFRPNSQKLDIYSKSNKKGPERRSCVKNGIKKLFYACFYVCSQTIGQNAFPAKLEQNCVLRLDFAHLF